MERTFWCRLHQHLIQVKMHYLKLTAVGFVCALSEAVVASKYLRITSANFPLIWSSKYRERCKTSNPVPHVSIGSSSSLFISLILPISCLVGIITVQLAHALLLIHWLNSSRQLTPRCQPQHLSRTRSCFGCRRYDSRCRSSIF